MKNFERHFASGRDRKDLIFKKAREADRFVKNGKNMGRDKIHYAYGYTFVDSPLDRDFESSFWMSFKDVLPITDRTGGLKTYIEKVLKNKKGEAIGIEFGGPGRKLFSDFTPGFFKKSIGVTLLNNKESEIKPQKKFFTWNEREKSEHKIIEGDIFSPDLYVSLDRELGGKKFDFITERMAAGLDLIPPEPYAISKIFQKWYILLAENGLMLVQSPVAFDNLMKKWAATIQEKYQNVLDIYYKSSKWSDENTDCCALRLRKLPGAPNELPFLDPRTIQDTELVEGQKRGGGV